MKRIRKLIKATAFSLNKVLIENILISIIINNITDEYAVTDKQYYKLLILLLLITYPIIINQLI